MRVLITGASGFVGRHLVASLRRDGKSVTVLARGMAPVDSADVFTGPPDLADLADLDSWPDWPKEIDSIVHLAARNPSRSEPAMPDALARANVAGTAALARRARREGVRRIVFLSTANVHAPGPAPVRESDPLRPQSPYARSKAEGEAAFWQALADGRTEGCVLRPAPVYGAGGRGNVAALVKLARLPLPLPIGGLGGSRSILAVDRLVSAITLCLIADKAAGETFLVADEAPLDPGEIVQALRQGWKRRGAVIALPDVLRRLVERSLGERGPMADFCLDVTHLAERTGWQAARSQQRLADLAAAGDL